MKLFEIYYEVDTGYEYVKSSAIVKANSEDEAIIKLKNYTREVGNEHHITKLFYAKEFKDEIFVSNPNARKRKTVM